MTRLAEIQRDASVHIVICIMNGFGDAFLALPLIRYALALFGGEHVTVWGSAQYGSSVYAELTDNVFVGIETDRTDERPYADVVRLRRALPQRCSLQWVSLNSYECAPENYAIKRLKPERVWKFGPDSQLNIRREGQGAPLIHRRDQYFRVIGEPHMPLNIQRRPAIDSGSQAVADLVRQQVSQAGKHLIAIHADPGTPERQWPTDCWRTVIDRFADSAVFALLGRQQQELVESELREAYSCAIVLDEVWSTQVALLAVADAFVGIDSCFAHVADACEVPGVVLFGAIDGGDTGLRKVAEMAQWRPISPHLSPLVAPGGCLGQVHPSSVIQSILSIFRIADDTVITSG